MASQSDFITQRQKTSQEMASQLARGRTAWQSPLDIGVFRPLPINPISNKNYRGFNRLKLDSYMAASDLTDPRWFTFQQINEQGGRVLKGEKATTVEYWQWGNKQQGNNPLNQSQAGYNLHHTNLFHASQTEGLAPYQAPKEKSLKESYAQIDQILEGSGIHFAFNNSNMRSFDPNQNILHMPSKSHFNNEADFYQTALTGALHAVAHPSRLNHQHGPFGSDIHAQAMLKTSMARYMLSAEYGIGYHPQDPILYNEKWAAQVKENPHMLFRAAIDAEMSLQWLQAPHLRQQLEQKAQEKAARRDQFIHGYSQQTQEPFNAMQRETPIPDHIQHSKQDPLDRENDRTYLNVPFDKRAQAKAAGAKFSRAEKLWYIKGQNSELLEKVSEWLPKNTALKTGENAQQTFGEVLKEAGFNIKGLPIMDGTWHRAHITDDKEKKKNGAYRGFLDAHPTGQYIDHKVGITHKWDSGKSTDFSQTTSRALQAQIRHDAKATAKIRDDSRKAEHEAAAKTAYGIYKNARLLKKGQIHPYLAKKQIDITGLKVNDKNNIIIPFYGPTGRLQNIQTITPEGEKFFLKGGNPIGGYTPLDSKNQIRNPDIPLIIAEGFSTAASLHMATNAPVVSVGTANNMVPVAEEFRKIFPNREIIIAADDDHHLPKRSRPLPNKGLEVGQKAAEKIKAKLIVPSLTEGEMTQGLTDFNDLHKSRGIGAIRAHFEDIKSLNFDQGKTKVNKFADELGVDSKKNQSPLATLSKSPHPQQKQNLNTSFSL